MADYGIGLVAEHVDVLVARSVTAELARERGYVSGLDVAQLERFGFSRAQRNPPALVIPVHSPAGELVAHMQRPDAPRLVNDKLLKYEWPFRRPLRLDVPPRCQPVIADPSVTLWITEGPLKADALAGAGAGCVVGITGVWNWRSKTGALSDWHDVALAERKVVLAFDSDVATNPQVRKALVELWGWLGNRGARPEVLYLVPDGDAKVGVDDFLAAGGVLAELEELVESRVRAAGASSEPAPKPDTFDDVPDEPGWVVLDDVAAFVARYTVLPSPAALIAITLWIAHTHCIDAFDVTARLALTSAEKQSGKTRGLEVVQLLARRARLVVNMSPAFMFRLIGAECPTLLVDETDALFGKHAEKNQEELRGLINAGYLRGATVGRIEGEGSKLTHKEWPVFCPVALAGIGTLPDTIIDRSIVVRMRRRAPNESVEPFRRRRVVGPAAALRRRLEAWAARSIQTLEAADPVMPEGITDRPADTWEALLAVADAAGGRWPARARVACLELDATRAENDTSRGIRLLTDIRTVFDVKPDPKPDRMPSIDLCARLDELDESTWEAIEPRRLARWLRPFGITPDVIRIDERKTARGYMRTSFDDSFDRYLPPLPGTVTTAANVTPQVAATSPVTSVALVTPPEGGSRHTQDNGALTEDELVRLAELDVARWNRFIFDRAKEKEQ